MPGGTAESNRHSHRRPQRPPPRPPKERDKCLFCAIYILTTILVTAIGHVSAGDADVMAKLAKSISPTPAGWTGSSFCKWHGISCDSSGQVTSINLASESVSGTLPSELNQLSSLKSLSLQRNQLSGALPALPSSVEEVNLDENSFNSVPSGFLSGLTSLQAFSIMNNTDLPPWEIPVSLKDSNSLVSFNASMANIVGEIPDIFDSMLNFQTLRLSYNNMTGWLPVSFSKSSIENLWINNQAMGFSGTLHVLGMMTQLKTVWLHSNKFSGPIPDLSACTELSELELRNNFLTGVIPDSLTKLPKLQMVTLQNNKFQGPVPSFRRGVEANLGTTNNFCLSTPGPCDPRVTALLEAVGAMNSPMILAESWEGNDPCKAWKFITCEGGSVTAINFGKQNWIGIISPAYANLTTLKTLLLNDNKLEGVIPVSLASLKQLQTLDLSNNNISGKVPDFPSSTTVKVSGNEFIGKDIPLRSPLERSYGGNGADIQSASASKSSVSPWGIAIPVLVSALLIVVLGFLIYRRHRNKRTNSYDSVSKASEEGNSGKQLIDIDPNAKSSNSASSLSETYDGGNITIPIDILREATDNFNENNILGKGGFGVVYRGQLHDGTRIAVKRMESSFITDKGLNEFKSEIEVLTKVRHRNLVALHGFCNNDSERLLVYEYMPKGCLCEHLFQWKKTGSPPLTWNQRVIIALDVARGVEYLHSLAQQSFIHRDLKPSNILLGDDIRAKVSDFGLVKAAPDGNHSFETKLAGTFGYLAPEYAATGKVTTKVDVYAFGVILMEMITGRKALDDSLPEEKCHLVTWFRRLLNDKNAVRAAVDPTLSSTMDEEGFHKIWKVAELAGHCTVREPQHRPDMSHPVNVLSSLVEQWKPGAAGADEDDSFGIDVHMSLPQVLQKWKANDDSSSALTSDYFINGNSTSYSTTR
ncbi:receptor-like kinase TMK4 [Sesamum indicum]|uniref:Receptor-like kinase TMK4 n=1 Tax=Sesamum indicum TaxID=4182 RepID=A0A8M8V1A8_SESIN|nr:receptor-like kinase TMK4 [Sesamum indicum]